MTSRPDGYRPVEAQGTLRLDTPGGRSLNLVADGDKLRMDLPDWKEARVLLPRSFRARRRALRFVANMFAIHGLTFHLEAAGKPVLRLGHGVTPSWFARLLGLAPANIPVSAIGTLFSRKKN